MDAFFAFRINKLFIKKNRDLFGDTEVKILSFIAAGGQPIPVLDGYTATNDLNEKKAIVAQAAKEVLSFKEFLTVDHIRDGQKMYFGDTGYSLYTSNFIPPSLDWSLLVFDSDEDIRVLGQKADAILATPEFDSFVANVITLVAGVVSPQAAIAIQIGKWLGKNIASAMKNKHDDQIGVFYMSFNQTEHYPHGVRNETDVPDLSGNCMVDYSLFGTEIGQNTCVV